MHLDTIKRDSVIDEDFITGGKRRERRASSITHHTPLICSESGQLIGWKKQETVLVDPDKPESMKQSPLHNRRFSEKRNSELVSLIKIEFPLTVIELVKGEREEKEEIYHVVDIALIFALN